MLKGVEQDAAAKNRLVGCRSILALDATSRSRALPPHVAMAWVRDGGWGRAEMGKQRRHSEALAAVRRQRGVHETLSEIKDRV